MTLPVDTRPDRLAESRAPLVELLHQDIERSGPITFARFMEAVLAHPTLGYYQAEESPVGSTGDFLTAPESDPIFGRTLARQVIDCWERLDGPAPFVVREFGAGSGALARDLLTGLASEAPEVLAATRYELSDLSQRRVTQALSLLAEAGFGGQVGLALKEPVIGLLLANELLDAFPVHRLVWRADGPRELYAGWRDGWFADVEGPVSDERIGSILVGVSLSEGQRLEVSLAALDWAAGLGNQIERGYAVLIDYGYPADELYRPERPSGTLKGYRAHRVSEDPYRSVGRQDLTAHVNFSAVAEAAQRGGMTTLGLTTQADFVVGLGIDQLVLELQNDPDRYRRAREAVLHLLDPRGLGRFRVLGLAKQAPVDPPLRGFRAGPPSASRL